MPPNTKKCCDRCEYTNVDGEAIEHCNNFRCACHTHSPEKCNEEVPFNGGYKLCGNSKPCKDHPTPTVEDWEEALSDYLAGKIEKSELARLLRGCFLKVKQQNFRSLRESDRKRTLETVICAAIKTKDGQIIRGHRHADAIKAAIDRGLELLRESGAQGFITSKNRYVDRKEAMLIQKSAGIQSVNKGGYLGDELYSEDLY